MIFNISQFWVTKNYDEIFWCLNEKNLLIHYELIFSICHRCGPDVTFWLWDQMNRNRHHTEIQHCGGWYKLFAWPRYLLKFAGLVGNCKPWDFKCTQTFRRGSCPSQSCPRTVTLCNQCINYDVPGNIHYGWVGRAVTIRRWLLLYAADRVQKGGLMIRKIRTQSKLEWICGMTRERGLGIRCARKLLKKLTPWTDKALLVVAVTPQDTKACITSVSLKGYIDRTEYASFTLFSYF